MAGQQSENIYVAIAIAYFAHYRYDEDHYGQEEGISDEVKVHSDYVLY